MVDPSRVLRNSAYRAGKQLQEAKRAYRHARDSVYAGELPQDEAGRARIVCRRYAEQRTVHLDAAGRPACFERGHRDCEGCHEDIQDGRIETW